MPVTGCSEQSELSEKRLCERKNISGKAPKGKRSLEPSPFLFTKFSGTMSPNFCSGTWSLNEIVTVLE